MARRAGVARGVGAALAGIAGLALAGCSSLPQSPEPLPSSFIPDIQASSAAQTPDDIVAGFTALEREALRVRVRTCDAYGTGSAFAIDDTHAVTNRHVAEGATDMTLTGYDGTRYTVKSSVLSPDSDLALLTIDGTLPNISNLADVEPSTGDTLTIAGYPLGEALAVREGPYVASVPDELDDAPDLVYQFDAESHPGNSGSPVANEAGEVVGVLYASDDVHTSFAVSLPTLERFLDNLDDAERNRATCESQG